MEAPPRVLRVLVVGGYGTFGARLCRLLAPDPRLHLLVAGRNGAAAAALCASLPAGAGREPAVFDRDGDVAAALAGARPDLLIDASGPFQGYGARPYRLVEACLAHGVHYLDFADGSAFVAGIHRFDAEAKARGLYVLSGVSSFPVLTAAVVRELARDVAQVEAIRAGIAPSPFADVGLNVLRAIAGYAGQPVPRVHAGRAFVAHGLTETMRFTIAPPGRLPLFNRLFSLVDVPDLRELPPLWPTAREVWVGAGPVPEPLHRLLVGLAWLVRLRLLPTLLPLAPVFLHAIRVLRRGEHRGGMFVEVAGRGDDGGARVRSWHLLAEGDDGPFIPCMALQAVIHRHLRGAPPAPGARAATSALELADYAPLFADRAICTGTREIRADAPPRGVFRMLLGDAWSTLPAPWRAVHDDDPRLHLAGRATVERGRGVLARLVAAAMRFPHAGDDVPVGVDIARDATGETWRRDFAGRRFASRVSRGRGRDDGLLVERFGPVRAGIALVIDGDRLRWIVRRWSLFGLPMPRAWAPGGESFESVADGRFRFDIEIALPLIGRVVRYAGWLEKP